VLLMIQFTLLILLVLLILKIVLLMTLLVSLLVVLSFMSKDLAGVLFVMTLLKWVKDFWLC